MSEVLIVEDEAPIRRLLHRWIDAEGVRAVEAESAEQGLLLASEEFPAVAFCDINLPRGQSGFWLVEQLHRLHPETSVVVTTRPPPVRRGCVGASRWSNRLHRQTVYSR